LKLNRQFTWACRACFEPTCTEDLQLIFVYANERSSLHEVQARIAFTFYGIFVFLCLYVLQINVIAFSLGRCHYKPKGSCLSLLQAT
jgi:hypothetical protein